MTNLVQFDSDGNIVQRDGDGGDCAARTGEYFTLLAIRDRLVGASNAGWPQGCRWKDAFRDATHSLIADDGKIYRYPEYPYNNLDDVSRDQTMPMIIAAIFANDWDFLKYIYLGLQKRSKFQNGDLIWLNELAIILRSAKYSDIDWPERFCLWACDLWLIFSVIVRCIQARDPNNVGDDINLSLYLLTSVFFHQTWLSRLARFIYAKCRPRGVQYAFDWYHRPESHGNPFNELARPIISLYLS